MDEYRENVKKVQKALNQDAAFIQPNPYLAQRVLNASNAGYKVKGVYGVRRKFSVTFIITLIFMLLTVTAVAAVMLNNYWESFAITEGTHGPYDKWPVNARVEMVQIMFDNGRTLNNEKVNQLFSDNELTEAQKGELADQILQEYFGEHSFLSTTQVMEHELGSFSEWSIEQKAFYTELMKENGLQGIDWPEYHMPEADDLYISEVLVIAQNALAEKYDLRGFESYSANVSFVKRTEFSKYGDQILWDVFFRAVSNPVEYYRVILTRSGDILAVESPGAPMLDWNVERIQGATYVAPQTCDATREEAIVTAKHVLTEVKQYEPEQIALWTARTSFFYHPDYCHGWEPVWLVTLIDESGKNMYDVLLGYDGIYIDAVPYGKEFSYTVARRIYPHDQLFPNGIKNASGEDFGKWSHEERAQFSSRYKPIVDEYLSANPYYANFAPTLYELTRCVYGTPDEDVIGESEAISIARNTVIEMGATQQGFGSRSIVVYYDITNSEKPVWRVYFSLSKEQVDDSYKNHYMVEIDALSGIVEQAKTLVRGVDSFYPYY